MGELDSMSWRRLPCPRSELRLDIVLRCGQSFRWRKREGKEDMEWAGALAGKAWALRQDDEGIEYRCFPSGGEQEDCATLKDYFQLDVKLAPLYKAWAEVDPVFEEISRSFQGVRMLRQHPVENIFSFICSSNNNISRISSMVENLCKNYGKRICEVDGEALHSFPTVSALAADHAAVEKKLRQLGFGYRAGYVAKTAVALEEKGGEKYLMGLREATYEHCREELLKLSGVGPKVADCILLMSLDQAGAIPVDTHMFQIAARKYLPHLRGHKTVTDRVYKEVAGHFRKLYGDHAGWAHSVLFSADLKHLQQQPDGKTEGDGDDGAAKSKRRKR